MKQFLISANDSGQRLDRFLSKAVPGLPSALMYKYLRIKRIKLNGKRAESSYKLCVGDTLELYINDEFFINDENREFLHVSDAIDAVYEDANILVVNKPSGLLCHSDASQSRNTLINMILSYLYKKGEYDPNSENSFTPALCNRIDRNTSGLVIAAKNAEALRVMCEKIKLREVKKYYKCAVFGKLQPPVGEYKSYLSKDGDSNTVTVYKAPHSGALTAISRYKTLKTTGELSLLEVELITGRTHQIRAQFADRGHPLLGDTKYGNAAASRPYGYDRQALLAYKVVFDFQTESGILSYLNGKVIQLGAAEFEQLFT